MFKLLQYYKPFSRNISLALLSNLMMSFFTVISIPILQPFLKILFNAAPTGAVKPEGGFSFKNLEAYSSWFFDNLIQEKGREGALLLVCGAIIVIFFGKNLFRYLSLFFLAPVRMGVVRNLRQQLVDKLMALPLSWFTASRKGDVMSRAMTDVMEIEWSILGVVESVAREPIVILGSLAFMLVVSPTLMVFVFVLMIFSGLIIGGLGRSLRKQSGDVQSRLGMLGSLIEETLGGLRIIKGFNAETYQQERFSRENAGYARTLTRLFRRRDLASPLSEFLGISVVAVLLWFGSRQVFSGHLEAETFITFLYAFYNVLDPAKALTQAFYNIRKGMGAVERVQEILGADLQIEEQASPVRIERFQTSIVFDKVSFQYANADRKALDEVSFEIPHGKIIALVGASGAGKSTVAVFTIPLVDKSLLMAPILKP